VSLLSSFKRSVREAGAPLAELGWTPRGVGFIHHHANGYWGQMVFGGASRPADPLVVNLTAGVCSPFLLELVNHQDPTRPPGPNFVATHAAVVWTRMVT
jgi:hypothetical protein